MSAGIEFDERHAASMWPTWTSWLIPLMSIAAPHKHLDHPLASWMGSLHRSDKTAF
jgi:hypothetical protein